jgi:hypothetical protein
MTPVRLAGRPGPWAPAPIGEIQAVFEDPDAIYILTKVLDQPPDGPDSASRHSPPG